MLFIMLTKVYRMLNIIIIIFLSLHIKNTTAEPFKAFGLNDSLYDALVDRLEKVSKDLNFDLGINKEIEAKKNADVNFGKKINLNELITTCRKVNKNDLREGGNPNKLNAGNHRNVALRRNKHKKNRAKLLKSRENSNIINSSGIRSDRKFEHQIPGSLYDQCKERLEQFTKELSIDPDKIFKRTTSNSLNISALNEVARQMADDYVKNLMKRKQRNKGILVNNSQANRKRDSNEINRYWNPLKPEFKLLPNENHIRTSYADDLSTFSQIPKSIRKTFDDEESHRNIVRQVRRKLTKLQADRFGPQKSKKQNEPLKHGNRISKKDTQSLRDTNDFLYPSVLTKPIGSTSGQNIMSTIAEQLNTTPLEIAKKVATIKDLNPSTMKKDPKLSKVLQKYIENSVLSATRAVGVIGNSTADVNTGKHNTSPSKQTKRTEMLATTAKLRSDENDNCATAAMPTKSDCKESTDKIASILEQLINKFETMQQDKFKDDEEETTTPIPDGAPCSLKGSWISHSEGVRFDITMCKHNLQQNLTSAERANKPLHVRVQDTTPPRKHNLITSSWLFAGSTTKELGGPFHMYSQMNPDKILASFTGFCRVCRGIDTIFGSWSFLYPSTDCQDVSTSVQTKHDFMRRYRLDDKRKDRTKEILYNKIKKPKPPEC